MIKSEYSKNVVNVANNANKCVQGRRKCLKHMQEKRGKKRSPAQTLAGTDLFREA